MCGHGFNPLPRPGWPGRLRSGRPRPGWPWPGRPQSVGLLRSAPGQVGPAQVGLGQVGPGQVGPSQVGPGQVGPWPGRPRPGWPRSGRPRSRSALTRLGVGPAPGRPQVRRPPRSAVVTRRDQSNINGPTQVFFPTGKKYRHPGILTQISVTPTGRKCPARRETRRRKRILHHCRAKFSKISFVIIMVNLLLSLFCGDYYSHYSTSKTFVNRFCTSFA